MRIIVLFCLLAQVAQAAIQNVSVLGMTATQALIHYTAPNNSPCNVEVSESSTYRPLVNDVDGSKFASAASDARPGAISNGVERTFVVGKRAAEVGLDTVRYSRALQAATQHYFRISCPSTGDQTTGTFQTTTIPFGASYAEPEASDPLQPGSYAYPTLSTSDRTQQVIDPQTGLAIKRLSLPQDLVAHVTGAPFPVTRSSGWMSLANLGSADGKPATVSGSTAPVFMGLNNSSPYLGQFQRPDSSAYQGPEGAYGFFQVHLIAAVNQGGSAPSNPDDATILACLTVDGATCYPGSSQYQAVLTNAYKDTPFGTTNTIDLWQATPGTALPRWPMMANRGGAVLCDGTTNVLLTGGSLFASNWGPGSTININNVDYAVAILNNTAQLTTAVNCPTSYIASGSFDAGSRTFRTTTDTFQSTDAGRQVVIPGAGGGTGLWLSWITQVVDARTAIINDQPAVTGATANIGLAYPYWATNFGVLISKKTASADTISVDYASVNYNLDLYFQFTDSGGYELCATQTVTGPNGRPGYNCAVSSGQLLYWVDAASAEAHFFGTLSTNPYVACGAESEVFDVNDPDTFYCAGTGTLYRTKYYGNHSEPVSVNPGGSIYVFQALPNCNTSNGGAPYASQQPCLVTQPLTPGTDLVTLAGAFASNPAYAPIYDTGHFRQISFKQVDEYGNLIFTITRGNNDTVGWNVIFSPSATSNSEGGSSTGTLNNHGCVGGGNAGCVVAATPGWARPGCRWCVVKDAYSPFPGWVVNYTYGWTNIGPGSGPYYVPVVNGAADGNLNYLDGSTSLVNCPANSFGAAGKNCSIVTVGSEPLSPNHGGGETGLPGELGAAMLGDRFAIEAQLPINNIEQMTLIGKQPGSQPGTWIYTLWRDVNHINGHSYSTSVVNPYLYTVCNANQIPGNQNSSSAWYWNFLADPHGMNQTGTTIPPNPATSVGHSYWSHGNGAYFGGPDTETRCTGGPQNCYSSNLLNNRPFVQVVMQPAPTAVATLSPHFGSGRADSSNHQSHPTGGGESAPSDRFNYMFDARPYYGGASSGSGAGNGSNPATLIGGQLYKFPASSMPNIDLPYRKIYPTTAFSGQTPLVDVSSPATGDVLGTSGSDAYKYCVAAAANECRQGSSVGDVYVNAPYVRYTYCVNAPQNGNLSDEFDICIAGSPMIRDAITQIGMSSVDNEGHHQRVLTKFRRARVISVFDSPYILPNGQWMIFESQFPGDGSLNKSYLLGKIPPPDPQDSYNRLDFIPISVTLPAFPGATQAYVRFGYAENGPQTSLFCTSRKESCVAGSQTAATSVDPANPFFFEQTESATWQAASCSQGCTVTVPGIPQRVLYYQFVYKSNSAVVYTSPVATTIVP